MRVYKTANKTLKLSARNNNFNRLYDGYECIIYRESSDEYYNKGRWSCFLPKNKKNFILNNSEFEKMYHRYNVTCLSGVLHCEHNSYYVDI